MFSNHSFFARFSNFEICKKRDLNICKKGNEAQSVLLPWKFQSQKIIKVFSTSRIAYFNLCVYLVDTVSAWGIILRDGLEFDVNCLLTVRLMLPFAPLCHDIFVSVRRITVNENVRFARKARATLCCHVADSLAFFQAAFSISAKFTDRSGHLIVRHTVSQPFRITQSPE